MPQLSVRFGGSRFRMRCGSRFREIETRDTDVREPLLTIFFEASPEQAPDRRWGRRWERVPIRLLHDDERQRVGDLRRVKGAPARQHFVEDATEGPDAGACSIALAKPKSSTFTMPSGRSLMFAGFRSR